jgi:hypothetical protein
MLSTPIRDCLRGIMLRKRAHASAAERNMQRFKLRPNLSGFQRNRHFFHSVRHHIHILWEEFAGVKR